MDTDQIAAEAAWTDDTVYDLLAEAFESGGEIRGGQLIAQRHNETVQSSIEKAVEQERQRWQNVHHDYIKLIESRAAHASEQGAVVRIKSLVCSGEWYHPDIRDRIIDICDSALSQRPTPAKECCDTKKGFGKCKHDEPTPATASEELHRKACEALWDGKPAHASESNDEQASIERGLRILGRKPYPPATASERPWSEVENSIGSNCPRKPPHAGGIGLSPATASEQGADVQGAIERLRNELEIFRSGEDAKHPYQFASDIETVCNALSQRPTPATVSEQRAVMREFVGWLSGDIPELHKVEVPRLAESLQRFLSQRPTPATKGKEL